MAVTERAKGINLTHDSYEACLLLQARISHFQHRSHWLTEQAEEALTEMLRHPDRTGNPHHLVRNALSNAKKKLNRRNARHQRPDPALRWGAGGPESADFAEVEIIDLVNRLSESDQEVLTPLIEGRDADQIAEILGHSVFRTRKRISRARSRARLALQEAA